MQNMREKYTFFFNVKLVYFYLNDLISSRNIAEQRYILLGASFSEKLWHCLLIKICMWFLSRPVLAYRKCMLA